MVPIFNAMVVAAYKLAISPTDQRGVLRPDPFMRQGPQAGH